MDLVFYTNAYSTYCTRVRFFLEEVGRAYSTHDIDLGKNEQHLPGFRGAYPLHKVPSIGYGNFKLSESNAIMRYLAARFERYDLYPLNLEARAEIDQWMDYTTQHICKYIGELVWYRAWAPLFKFQVNAVTEAHAEKYLLTFLPNVNERLRVSTHLCGEALSLADISFLPFLDIFGKTGLSLKTFPSVESYAQKLMQRDAWRRTKALIK